MIYEDGCPCTGDEPFVFVSYAHKNRKEVMPVIQWLNDNNYHIWYDNGIHSGEFASIIEEKLEKAVCVIAFLSDEYIESINCRNEINYAIKKNKVILPICMKPTTLRNGMELQLVSYHFIYRYQLDETAFYEHLRQSPEIQAAQGKNSSNSLKYTAFISCRDCSLDIRIAKELQKRIEHYSVPEDLCVEEKNFGLVFLDRNDFPMNNDLPESICTALDLSQYLIVICTPETPKSQWIEREIQYFIEKHGRERILPVLVAGTPEESSPRSIMGIEEPLHIDLRGTDEKSVMKNLNKEFLRLAAVLLGCRYGDLVQRRRRFWG